MPLPPIVDLLEPGRLMSEPIPNPSTPNGNASVYGATVRPPSLRNLRAGRVAVEPVVGNRFVDLPEFTSGLEAAIAAAVGSGHQVAVFRLRHRRLGLQIWSELDAASDSRAANAVNRRLVSVDVPLALHRLSPKDLLSYAAVADQSDARRIAGRILALMTGVFEDEGAPGRAFGISPRLGLAIAGDGLPTADAAIEAVTQTLVQTDHAAPYLVYNEYIRRRSQRDARIQREIPLAVADGRITAGYRGRFSADDGRLVALEVYPRWEDQPAAGGVAPGGQQPERRVTVAELLRLSERSGDLFDIGQVVRRTAGADAVDWHQQNLLAGKRMWFNVAPAELCHTSFLSSLIEFRDVHPEIEFGVELNDSALLEEPICAGPFELLRQADVAVALDTVTMSSLSFGRIQRLPLTEIHLGRDLVHALPISKPGRELVRLICETAHDRGTAVVASEVETEEEVQLAAALGVDMLQGPALSGSMSGPDAQDLLRKGSSPDRRHTAKAELS